MTVILVFVKVLIHATGAANVILLPNANPSLCSITFVTSIIVIVNCYGYLGSRAFTLVFVGTSKPCLKYVLFGIVWASLPLPLPLVLGVLANKKKKGKTGNEFKIDKRK